MALEIDELPHGWRMQPLRECVAPKEHWSQRLSPRERIRYVELAGIDNDRGVIASYADIEAAKAPSRAKKIIRAGDVIFATTRPNLKNIAIVPCELDNEICSTGFCVLRPKPDMLMSGWIFSIVRSDWFITRVIRNDEKNAYPSVSDSEVLAVEVPLPPLPEQRRMVERVEAITSRMHELIDHTRVLAEAVDRTLAAFYDRMIDGAPSRPFGEIAKFVRRAIKTTPDGRYGEMGIRSFGKGTFPKPIMTGAQLGEKRVYCIRVADLVFMNVFAWEGAIAVAQADDGGRVGSHRFLTHEVNTDLATAEFLCFHFLTPQGLEKIDAASPGSAGRNRTLGIEKLAQIHVPVPAIENQRRFARMIRLQHELRRLQRQVESELAAFVPALLAKAFRGEL